MKVLLVLAPNPVLAEPLMQAPLGILYVAASLEKAGHQVEILDLRDRKIAEDVYIPEADFYGFSATTPEYPFTLKMANYVKAIYPNAKTIIGGSHPTHLPQTCLDEFDYVVVGDGEYAVNAIVEGKIPKGIVQFPPIMDLDTVPFPARHLLPRERVFTEELYVGSRCGKGPPSTSIMSSRGCPYSCHFCANPPPRLARMRSPENFVKEVEQLINVYNCSHYKIVDDNFTLNKKRLLKICDLLKPLNIEFRAHGRSQLFNKEIAKALYQAGCREFSFGVEVADNYVLYKLHKQETVEQHKKAIKIAKEAGLQVKVYLMCCLPYETWETIEKNKQFMIETQPDKWTLSTFVPYPGSYIYSHPEEFDITWMEKDWNKYWLYENQSMIATTVATKEELTEHRNHLYAWLLSEQWKHK